jgi:hypothetical protein
MPIFFSLIFYAVRWSARRGLHLTAHAGAAGFFLFFEFFLWRGGGFLNVGGASAIAPLASTSWPSTISPANRR